MQLSDFPDAPEADTFPDETHHPKMTLAPPYNDAHVSKFSDQNSTELINSVMVRTEKTSDSDFSKKCRPLI